MKFKVHSTNMYRPSFIQNIYIMYFKILVKLEIYQNIYRLFWI